MCNDLDVVPSSRVGEHDYLIIQHSNNAEEEGFHVSYMLKATLYAFSNQHVTHVSRLRVS